MYNIYIHCFFLKPGQIKAKCTVCNCKCECSEIKKCLFNLKNNLRRFDNFINMHQQVNDRIHKIAILLVCAVLLSSFVGIAFLLISFSRMQLELDELMLFRRAFYSDFSIESGIIIIHWIELQSSLQL